MAVRVSDGRDSDGYCCYKGIAYRSPVEMEQFYILTVIIVTMLGTTWHRTTYVHLHIIAHKHLRDW